MPIVPGVINNGVISKWLSSKPSVTQMLTVDADGNVGRQAIPSAPALAWGNITGTLSAQTDLQDALDNKAPFVHGHVIGDITNLSSTLGAIDIALAALDAAKLNTSAFTFANLGSKPTTLSGYGITDAQPVDADLTAIAALTTQPYGRSLLTQADASAARTTLGLGSLATQNGTISDYLLSATAASTYLPLAGGTLTGLVNANSTADITTSPKLLSFQHNGIERGYVRNINNVLDGIPVTELSVRRILLGGNESAYGPVGLYGGGQSKIYFTSNGEHIVFQGQSLAHWMFINGAQGLIQFGAGLRFTAPQNASSTADLAIERDAADTLGLRRGTNAQTFRIYNAFTDSSNHDRAFARWNSNVFEIGTERLGSYVTGRPLAFVVDGVERARITAAGNFGYNTNAPAGQFDVRFLRTGQVGPDVTAGQTITASSNYGGSNTSTYYGAINLIDDVLGAADENGWSSAYTALTNQWVRLQFGTARVITRLTVINGSIAGSNAGARRCEFQGSNDGTNWTKLPAIIVSNGPTIINTDEFELAQNVSNKQVIEFNNSTAYTFYRLFMYNNWGSVNYIGLREIEMMEPGLVSVADPRIFAGQNIGLGTTSPTAFVSIVPAALDAGSPIGFNFTGAAHTTLAASTEASDVVWNLARSIQFSTGALTTQRAFRIQAPTYSFWGASTITTAATVSISGNPIAGTNATITNPFALMLESGRLGIFGPGTNEIFIASDASNAPGALRLRNRSVLFGDAGNGGWITSGGQNTEPGNIAFGFGVTAGSNSIAGLTSRGWVFVGANTPVHFGSAEIANPSGVAIVCPSNHVWEQRWTTNSQTWRLYNTFTNTSNYIRQALSFTTYSGTVYAQWLAEGLGTGAVNIPMVISPRGTGAFIVGPMPDGTSVGGNARGANAVDLQLSRSAATQVASGSGAFTAGVGCTASGSTCVAVGLFSAAIAGNSCFVFGDYATASGEYSFAFGRGTSSAWHSYGFGRGFLSNRSGQFSFANGSFSTGGDAQNTKFVARCTTSGTTPGNLLLGTSWGASATDRISINSGEVFGFLINIIGSKSDGSALTHYIRKGAIKRVSNTTTLAYVETVGTDYEDNAATDVSITADDTNDALQISVTGIAGETWRWVATIEAADLGFGT